jgi:hypothetical protein
MKKFFLAPLLGALAMFVFGFLYWGISPLPYKSLGRVPDDAAAASALAKIFPSTGLYFLPGMYLDPATHQELAQKGPLAEVNYIAHGAPMFDPRTLAKGFIHNYVLCLLLVLLLGTVMPAFQGVGCVVRLCAMIGLVLAAGHYADVIWWNYSIAWETWRALYDLLAFVIVGAILGKMLVPKPKAVASPEPASAPVPAR